MFVDHPQMRYIGQRVVHLCGAERAALVKEDRYFCEFLRDGAEDPESGEIGPAPKVYELIPTIDTVREKAQEYLAKFNDQFKLLKTDLVFFHDCIEHLLRISRIFAMSRGCALLVGVGGSGKQSLTRLAAYISTAMLFQITVTRSYNATNLLEDFKPLYRRAGVQGKPVCFLFTDKEIKDEGFLEYVNIFLNTGELPNLFPRDELDAILGEMGPVYDSVHKGSEPTQDQLWNMFIERVRTNLHLSLCFLLSGSNSATAHRPSPGSSMGALSTGSCRGRSRRSPTWRRHSSAASTA